MKLWIDLNPSDKEGFDKICHSLFKVPGRLVSEFSLSSPRLAWKLGTKQDEQPIALKSQFWVWLIFSLICAACSQQDSAPGQGGIGEQTVIPAASFTAEEISTPLPTPGSSPAYTQAIPVTEEQSREIAFVMQVIDGDTIEVILNGESYKLRYIGIDAPEPGMDCSQESTDANRSMVENQIVELERDFSDIDQYGRLLRYVYLPDGTLVNAELVRLGLAVALAYPPDTKHQEIINLNELEARNSAACIWKPATSTPSLPGLESDIDLAIDPECSQFNAPGNDNENKKEEYVCIVNQGPSAADMSGWSVHDDYGWTFEFPGFSLPAGSVVKVITGCGDNTGSELYWCKDETAVWNNDGDCVFLSDSQGELILQYCY